MQRLPALLLGLLLGAALASAETPAGYLKSLDAPHFKPGNTMAPLTRYGWTLPFDARVELAERWGYCLEFGGYVTDKSVANLNKPDSIESKIVALTASDPARYPLFVICSRQLPRDGSPDMWARDAQGHFLNAKAQSLDGTEWNPKMKTVYSPEAPDSVWQQAGKFRAEPIAAVRAKCPIAIVLNGGEYGLGVLGFARKVWEQDPRILAAKGDRSWVDYISEPKAHAETIIADAVKAVVPDRQLYIFYPTTGGTHRNQYATWLDWGWEYKYMKPVSDLASSECYYRSFNSGYTGKEDMLTELLDARGHEIACGQPLSYNWLCGGWLHGKTPEEQAANLSPLDRYMGFLKCAYATGTVGGNAGYYAFPKGGFQAAFDADKPPHWLLQMVVTARVQALYSHLENYLRQGDLLPGPDTHVWSKDQPAYEFPTGDPDSRVVVRKLKDQPSWLLVAWAAGGDSRDVTVTVPTLGQVTLHARPAATVYTATLADGKPLLKLIDTNPLLPTQTL